MALFREKTGRYISDNDIKIYYLVFPNINPLTLPLDIFNESELKEYNKYRFQQKKLQYYFSRWLLKEVLSKYYNQKPRQIHFTANSYGKLYISKEFANKKGQIYFNLSHSHNIVVCAFTLNHEIGVDVQIINDHIAKSIHLWMSPDEISYFNKHKAEEQNFIANKFWTMKESYVKAKGKGFIQNPKSIDLLNNNNSVFFYSNMIKGKYFLSVAVEQDKNSSKEFNIEKIDMDNIFRRQILVRII